MSDILYIGFDEGGPTCQVCGDYRADAHEVSCVKCGTLHHEDCWKFIGKCSTFGCGSKRWGEPKEDEVMVLHVHEDDPDPVIPGWKAPVGRGRPNSSPATRMAMNMVVKSKAVDITAPRVRLDLTTPLENGSGTMAILMMMIGLFFANGLASMAALAVGMFSSVFWLNTDCTYIVNNDDRTLDYRRQIFSSVEYSTVFRFDEVKVVAVKGSYHRSKNSSWWEYRPVAVLRNGNVVELTDSVRRDMGQAVANAAAFARHIGAECMPAEPEKELEVTWTDQQVLVRYRNAGWFG